MTGRFGRSLPRCRSNGVTERTAIVENAWLFGRNLHAAHHERPGLPWYAIPGWYRAIRDRLIRANGGLVYDGYLDVARRYLFRPHDRPCHPLGRAPQQPSKARTTHAIHTPV